MTDNSKVTAIKCKYLLSMAEGKEGQIEKDQTLVIKEKKIQWVGSSLDFKPPSSDTQIIHQENHLVCPGLINTHTHLPMSLFKGIGDHLTLKDWLEKVIFPLEKKMINPDFIRVGTELAALELIKGGTTTVCDMYFHTPVMAEVLQSFGLRATLAVDMLSSFSDWKKELDELCEKYPKEKSKDNQIYPALACHAPYTCSLEILKLSAQEAQKRNLPIVIHVAETEWEMAEIQKRHGKTPVAHLQDCGVIGPHCLFVHGVHLTEEDMDIMAQTQTPLSYNPESNMKLGSGIAPILRAKEKGITVGLGTDGSASNNNLNLWAEMDTGAKLQKLKNPTKTIEPKDIFAMVTSSASKALGLSHSIGRIQAGFFADLIGVNLNHPHFYPQNNLLNHLVYSAGGGEVDFVMCNGKTLMKDSQIQNKDINKIYTQAEKIKEKLHEHLD